MCTVHKRSVKAVWKQDFHVRWDMHGADHGSAQDANAIPCEYSLLVKGCRLFRFLARDRAASAVFLVVVIISAPYILFPNDRHGLYVQARGGYGLRVESRRRRMPGAALNLQSVETELNSRKDEAMKSLRTSQPLDSDFQIYQF